MQKWQGSWGWIWQPAQPPPNRPSRGGYVATGFREVLSTKAFLKKAFFLECRFKNYTHLKIEGNLKGETRRAAFLWQIKQHCPWRDKVLAERTLSRGTLCTQVSVTHRRPSVTTERIKYTQRRDKGPPLLTLWILGPELQGPRSNIHSCSPSDQWHGTACVCGRDCFLQFCGPCQRQASILGSYWRGATCYLVKYDGKYYIYHSQCSPSLPWGVSMGIGSSDPFQRGKVTCSHSWSPALISRLHLRHQS